MRIGVDATSWVNRRGYGRFTRNALGRLVDLDREARYLLYIDERSAVRAELPAGAEIIRVPTSRPPAEAASADSHRPLLDLTRLARTVARARLDAFLFPSVYTWFPAPRTPSVVGLHDLIPDDFPELTLPTRRARAFWRLKQSGAVRLAARLFTVSEASRAALASRLRLAPERIAVVPEAPDPVFAPRTGEEALSELGTVGLRPGEPFLLYAGGISPHKDVETLLAAYAELRERPRLVVAGALDDDPYLSAAAGVRGRISDLGLGSCVLLPGYVSDEQLACLYSAAGAVVLPSLAEGFGLPAVEAAACGAPVVLSDIPAHRETMGEAALYFEPRDAAALRAQLERVLGDDEVRIGLAERARRQVAALTWDGAAEVLRGLLHGAARA
jgi:glycosyltransferase involved in cell wall biosynthesis